MSKNFTTTIYNNPNPIGFDMEVYSIQVFLSRIPWLQAVFGLSHIEKRQKSEGDASTSKREGYSGDKRYDVYYPQGYFSGIPYDLTFDDSYASRAFFLTKETNVNPKTDNWNNIEQNIEIAQSFSLILHVNLNSLEISSPEQIKNDLLWALNPCYKLSGLRISESIDDIWKEFTVTPEMAGVARFPFYAIRFDGIITYLAFPYNGEQIYDPGLTVQYRSIIGWKVCQIQCNVFSNTYSNNKDWQIGNNVLYNNLHYSAINELIDYIGNPSTDSTNWDLISFPNTNQTLCNGDVIPLFYNANSDGTLSMPYLVSVNGITLLSRFLLNNDYFQGIFFINGLINISRFGVLGTGSNLNFDASIPIWSN